MIPYVSDVDSFFLPYSSPYIDFYQTLALHLIFRHLTQHERTSALFIDTVGDLSPERVVSLAGQADCTESVSSFTPLVLMYS